MLEKIKTELDKSDVITSSVVTKRPIPLENVGMDPYNILFAYNSTLYKTLVTESSYDYSHEKGYKAFDTKTGGENLHYGEANRWRIGNLVWNNTFGENVFDDKNPWIEIDLGSSVLTSLEIHFKHDLYDPDEFYILTRMDNTVDYTRADIIGTFTNNRNWPGFTWKTFDIPPENYRLGRYYRIVVTDNFWRNHNGRSYILYMK